MRMEQESFEERKARGQADWRALILFLLCIIGLVPLAQADVALKDGGFHSEYADITSGEGTDSGLTRYYNSADQRVGWFGVGWGSSYETRISQTYNGGLALHEHGNGKVIYFSPKDSPVVNTDMAIDRMIDAIDLLDESVNIRELKRRLYDDITFRNTFWQQLVDEGDVKTDEFVSDQVFESHQCGCRRIEATDEGFKYYLNGKLASLFDRKGRLTTLFREDGGQVMINYAGQSIEIRNQASRTITLSMPLDRYFRHVVSSLETDSGDSVHYVHGQSGHLLAVYSHKHSHEQERLNYWYGEGGLLIQIRSDHDDDDAVIRYQADANKVAFYQKSSGEIFHYYYNRLRTAQGVRQIKAYERGGYPGHESRRQIIYTMPETSDGQLRVSVRRIISGALNETVHYATDGLPEEIRRNGRVTTFQYAPETRLLVRKQTPDETIILSYAKHIRKIAHVRKIRSDRSETWTTFRYNDHGDLIFAENAAGKKVRLAYGTSGDQAGKLIRLNNDIADISFTYNNIGETSLISVHGIGSIRVTYDADGEIDQVHSDQGHEVSLKISQAFQSLLSLVKPAGVSLSW